MKKIFISILFTSTFVLFSQILEVQSERKMARIVHLIEQSDFTKKVLEDKKAIESDIAVFKRKQDQLQISPEDIAEIKASYDASKIKFDRLLDDLKLDFSKKKVRNSIAKKPNEICNDLSVRYNQAIKYYNDTCRKKIESLIEADSGAFDPLLIITVIGISGETFRIFSEIRQAKIEAAMEYFERNYISDKRLKSWEVL